MIIYHAGNQIELGHKVHLVTDRSDRTANDLRARFIEFWCLENCDGDWSLTETENSIDVSFDDETEMALFKLGPEFNEH